MTTRPLQTQVFHLDPKDTLEEARSQRNADGSALLFYKSGTMVKLEKPPLYLEPSSGEGALMWLPTAPIPK